MKLTKIQISNHKRIADLQIEVRDHLILVGPNDVGKSSILRCLDLLLGCSSAQIYSQISIDDFRDRNMPFLVQATLDQFSDDDKALYPDEINFDSVTKISSLTVRLTATIDDSDILSVDRRAVGSGAARQLSRIQIAGLGWKFVSSDAYGRDLRSGRKSPLDQILNTVDLGGEEELFRNIETQFSDALAGSSTLAELRESLAGQLSKALPEKIETKDLAFIPGSSADSDVLSDVRLQVLKNEEPRDLSAQSDGTRALFAMAFYDLVSSGANVVAVDEPEIHLHPTSQRSLARLLRSNPNQKVLATHSADIVGAFDPDSVVAIHAGGVAVQPDAGFLSGDERTAVRWWVRDRLEPLTARRIIAVEGLSDRIVLERVADLTGRNLDRLGISVLELGGAGDMGVIEKLFGTTGFDVPMSRLVDEDAELEVANQLGLVPDDLSEHSIWVSRRDLEDEYVKALGAAAVWDACRSYRQFSVNELRNGPTDAVSESAVADFCRRSSKYKIKAAISVANILTRNAAAQIASIDNLLAEVAQI